MRFVLYPYRLGSESASRLSEALPAHKVRPDGRYRYRPGDVIVNWGNSTVPAWAELPAYENMLNLPQLVGLASNKLRCFRELTAAGVATVPWTDNRQLALTWFGDGSAVYARTVLQGHSGEGIVIATNSQELPEAPLYTKRVIVRGEYRVHVFDGQIIDYRKKSRRDGDEPTADQHSIRTLANGWIYRAENLPRIERVEQLALRAIEAIGLDFGAVDIVIDDVDSNAKVLEINTAVGLEDRTLENYINAIRNKYAQQ